MRLGRRSRVRVHTEAPSGGVGPTYEGILIERTRREYVLTRVAILEGEDQTIELEGDIEVPRERVIFLEMIARSA